MTKQLKPAPRDCRPIVVGATASGVPRGLSARGCGRTASPWKATTVVNWNRGCHGRSVQPSHAGNNLKRERIMWMVIIAFVLSLVVMAVGISGGSSFGDGMARYILAFLPGSAGLALAVVALVVLLIPATSGWAWLPSVLSYCATLGMIAYVGVMNLLSRLFG